MRATGADVQINPRAVEIKDFKDLLERLDRIERNQIETQADNLKAMMALATALDGGQVKNGPLLKAIQRLEAKLEPVEYQFTIDRETSGYVDKVRAVPVRSKRDR